MRLRLSRREDARREHRITRWTGAAIATATASVLLSSAVPAAAPPPQPFGLAARS